MKTEAIIGLVALVIALGAIAIGAAALTETIETHHHPTHVETKDIEAIEMAIAKQANFLAMDATHLLSLQEWVDYLNATQVQHKDEILKNRDLIATTQYGSGPPVESDDSQNINEINIQYNQNTYSIGDIVQITGSGQPEGFVIVDVKLPTDIERQVNGYVDSRGNFVVHIIIKSDDPLGQWTVKIRDSGGQRTNSSFLVE